MSSPLIEQLTTQHGYPLLDKTTFQAFIDAHDTVVLLFTEDPKRYPEANDVAVVLPELMSVFKDRMSAAVIDRTYERELQKTYEFNYWPTLVFLKKGQYLGNIGKIKDWSEYMEDIPKILDSEPSRNPGLGIPVITEARA